MECATTALVMATNEQEKIIPRQKKKKPHSSSSRRCVAKRQRNNKFILDRGASSHMYFNPDLFFEFARQTNSYITLAEDKPAKITGKGSVRITVPDEKCSTETLKLENVLCVPELKTNLLSTSKFTRNNCVVVFDAHEAKVILEDKVTCRTRRKSVVYRTNLRKSSCRHRIINLASKLRTFERE
ncbi:hypothetical protein JTE90_010491 [Oedothorax gibbosus]|uniref:Retrovirus-related Pol polyprotein from transposon TNT 1-94-like beta-barrel domain-containing protein n=1 Tax=Oedothorax gibbosus TaxID=931172 RepID=A0AAV6W4A0_9ARAC|nr:hypothetical protein JTE90_010491 [Oedothorax gibbosus]